MQKSLGRGAARYTSRHTAYTAPAAAWWPAPRTLRAGALAAGSSSLPAAALSGAAPAPRQQQLQRGQQRLSAAAAAAVEGVDDAISEEVEVGRPAEQHTRQPPPPHNQAAAPRRPVPHTPLLPRAPHTKACTLASTLASPPPTLPCSALHLNLTPYHCSVRPGVCRGPGQGGR
jgi:hypothetical protein